MIRYPLASATTLLATWLCVGCGGGDTPKPEVARQTPTDKTDQPASERQPTEDPQAAARRVAEQAAEAERKARAELDAQRTRQLRDSEQPANAAPPVEDPDALPRETLSRFLLLTPDGPLICELVLTLDSRPLNQPLQDLIDRALVAADTDGDGEATWKELVAEPAFRGGQYGNIAIEDGRDDDFIRMYDNDRDGLVDRDELPRLVTRNAGRGRSFSIRSANYYYEANRLDSPTRLLIDADRDGQITVEEAEAAASRLRSRDVDEDEILRIDELLADSEGMTPEPLAQRRTNSPDAVVPLDGTQPWTRVLYYLEERYEARARLRPDSFRLPFPLFTQLDADRDGRVSPTETSRLDLLRAHLRLQVRFGAVDDEPRIHVLRTAPGLTPLVTRHDGRLWLDFDRFSLQIFVQDGQPQDFDALAIQQIDPLDIDLSGYLERDELADDEPIAMAFEQLDLDGDGKLYPEELAESRRLEQASFNSQVRSRVGFHRDALFVALDRDRDGRLTPREMDVAPERIAELDRDDDGVVYVDEVPDSMLLGLVRGDPQQDQAAFVPPRGRATPGDSAPLWFRRMDRNQDGELSRQEFLGTDEQHRQLDADQDGYLSAEEATAA